MQCRKSVNVNIKCNVMAEEALTIQHLFLYSKYNHVSAASIFCVHLIMRDIENSSICYYDIGIVLDHCNAIKPT